MKKTWTILGSVAAAAAMGLSCFACSSPWKRTINANGAHGLWTVPLDSDVIYSLNIRHLNVKNANLIIAAAESDASAVKLDMAEAMYENGVSLNVVETEIQINGNKSVRYDTDALVLSLGVKLDKITIDGAVSAVLQAHRFTDAQAEYQFLLTDAASMTVKADIVARLLTVEEDNAASVTLGKMTAESLKSQLQNASALKAKAFVNSLTLDASNASAATLDGTVESAVLSVYNSSTLNAQNATMGSVFVSVESASTAKLTATTSVSGTIKNSSALHVWGDAVIDVETQNASSVKRL